MSSRSLKGVPPPSDKPEDQNQRILGLRECAASWLPPSIDFDLRKDAANGHHLEHQPAPEC